MVLPEMFGDLEPLKVFLLFTLNVVLMFAARCLRRRRRCNWSQEATARVC